MPGWPPKPLPEAADNVDVAGGKRTALVALLAIPSPRCSVRKVGTHNLTVVISAAAARAYPSPVSRQLRQTISELWPAHLTYLEGDDGLRRRRVFVKAHAVARFPRAERGISFQM